MIFISDLDFSLIDFRRQRLAGGLAYFNNNRKCFVLEISFLYIVLTLLCAILYFLSGMSGFDAFSHAMTTIATGGFSTSDQSFAKFSSDSIEWICVIFMVLGSLPFAVYLKSLHGDFKSFVKDDQIKLFFGLTFILVVAMTVWLIIISNQQ